MSKKIRIGIVGAGGIVKSRHVPGLRQIADVELVCVANRSETSSRQAAKELGIGEIAKDWQTLVARKDLDVVWIGTWPSMHAPVSIAALEAGKHVFCQARMARYLTEAVAMEAAARKHAKQISMLCPPPHYLAVDGAVRRLLREGFCGAIRHVRVASMGKGLCDPNAPRSWRLSEEESGVQTLDLGIQAEVVHRWVGLPERVSAEGFIFTPERPDPANVVKKLPVTTFEQVVVNCRMSGAGGAIRKQAAFSLQYAMSGCIPAASAGSAGSLEIYGSAGAILVEPSSAVVKTATAKQPDQWQALDLEKSPEKKEWTVEKDFIAAVRTGDAATVEPNFQHGLDYMRFMQAVVDSAKTGQTVKMAGA